MASPRKKGGRYARWSGNAWRNARCNACGIAARWLFAASLSYAADNHTDGKVPKHMLGALLGELPDALLDVDHAAELVAAGLWAETAKGYEIVGYLDHNISQCEWESEAERRSEHARKASVARWEKEAASKARSNPRHHDTMTQDVKTSETPSLGCASLGAREREAAAAEDEPAIRAVGDLEPIGAIALGAIGQVPEATEALGVSTRPERPPAASGDTLTADDVIRTVEPIWREQHGRSLGIGMGRPDMERAVGLLRWARSEEPDDPLRLISELWARFTADCDPASLHSPWAAFCASPGRYAAQGREDRDAEAKKRAKARRKRIERLEERKAALEFKGRWDEAAKVVAQIDQEMRV